MNKIRLGALLTGLLLMLVGFVRITFTAFQAEDANIYSPVLLIIIGGILVIAVRKK